MEEHGGQSEVAVADAPLDRIGDALSQMNMRPAEVLIACDAIEEDACNPVYITQRYEELVAESAKKYPVEAARMRAVQRLRVRQLHDVTILIRAEQERGLTMDHMRNFVEHQQELIKLLAAIEEDPEKVFRDTLLGLNVSDEDRATLLDVFLHEQNGILSMVDINTGEIVLGDVYMQNDMGAHKVAIMLRHFVAAINTNPDTKTRLFKVHFKACSMHQVGHIYASEGGAPQGMQ